MSQSPSQVAVLHAQDPCLDAIAKALMATMQELNASAAALQSFDVIANLLERPKDESMGDVALPCFRMAKDFQKNPAQLATELAAKVVQHSQGWLVSAKAVGPFLNMTVAAHVLAQDLYQTLQNKTFFGRVKARNPKAPRVMIEYSQPNTHKVFHVGHMRNVALGDSLWRIYDYCGYPAIPVNYIGDEGAHIAKCLWFIDRNKLQAPATGKGEWLGEIYTQATHALEDASTEQRPQFEQEIGKVLAAIESKQGHFYQLWQETRQWSLDVFNEIYTWLGARFDHCFYESEVSEEAQAIVTEYLQKKVFIEDQGAIGVDLKDFKLGFALYRKRDGNTLYATKDLALARRKFDEFKIQKSIYVVAAEQNLHFKQVFKTLELMGFKQSADCYHLSYGLVVLPDGKMSSRKGNIIAFAELKARMGAELEKFLAKYRGEWSDAEVEETKRRLCVGAIRYGMICSDPVKEIVFDINDWLSFEGNTGPYLMYSYARSRSILRKAQEQGQRFDPSKLVTLLQLLGDHKSVTLSREEHELLLALHRFNEAVAGACQQNRPSILTQHLYEMCKTFNRFHKNVSVLKAESNELMQQRLQLVEAFGTVLRQGLNLLGIEPPERM